VTDAATREAPRETGTRLLTIPRPGNRQKPATELRITLDTFEGHQFIGARVWEQGADRNFYPTPRGITIRPRELYEVIRALCAAAKTLAIDLHPKDPAPPADGAPSG